MAKKKRLTIENCQKEIKEMLHKCGMWSDDLAVQAEVVGSQLFLYRKALAETVNASVVVAGSAGQDAINPIFEQCRKFSDDLRKGLASLQMNREKVTASAGKRQKAEEEQNNMQKFMNELNARFGE